jgi:hypothetical protein
MVNQCGHTSGQNKFFRDGPSHGPEIRIEEFCESLVQSRRALWTITVGEMRRPVDIKLTKTMSVVRFRIYYEGR